MNVSAIDPSKAALAQSAAATSTSTKKTAPTAEPVEARAAAASGPHAAARPHAAPATPAATVALTGVPATVKAEDRALYMQILKSVGGNVNAALAGLAAAEAKKADS